MSKKQITKIVAVVSMVCVLIAVIVITMICSKNDTHSKETKKVETTTELKVKKEQTKEVKKKHKNKKKNAKKHKKFYSKKFRKIKVVKIYDDSEKTDDYTDEIAEIYKTPALGADEAGVALEGCVVKVLKKDKTWTKIKSGKVEGYIESKYIVTGKEAKKVLLRTDSLSVKVKSKNIKIKKDNNKKSATVGTAHKKSKYTVVSIDKKQKWVQIKRGDTVLGWVKTSKVKLQLDKEEAYTSKQYDSMVKTQWTGGIVGYSLSKSDLPKDEEARALISYAAQFLGNRYVWGGTSLTRGADCSGFVQSVFRHAGYSLNRTAAEQAHNGKSVSLNKLKPGDLVFFHTDKRSPKRISHVAIYIGNGKVIHSANRKVGMVVSTLGNPCAARRILSKSPSKDKKITKNKNNKKNNKKKNAKKKNKKQNNTKKDTVKIPETEQPTTEKVTETEAEETTLASTETDTQEDM